MLKGSKHFKITRIAIAGVSFVMCGAILIGLGGSQQPSSTEIKGSYTTPWTLSSNNPLLNQGEDYYVDVEAPKGTSVPDFLEEKEISLGDIKDLAEKMSEGVDAAPSDVETYEVHEDEGLIYNPIYRESAKTGILDKYAKAYTTKGTIELGDTTLTYEVPKNATAYDTVPIKYTMTTKNEEWLPIFVSADANEEADRVKEGDQYYDLHYPNRVELQFEYLGYVAASFDESLRPQFNTNQTYYADSYRIARLNTTADGTTSTVELDKDVRLLTGEISGLHTIYLRNVDAGAATVTKLILYRADGSAKELICDANWMVHKGSATKEDGQITKFGNEAIIAIENVDFGKDEFTKIAVAAIGTTADKTIDVYMDGLPAISYTEDREGTSYPNASEMTELTFSKDVKAAQGNWIKLKYTNIGDTVIDSDGEGYVQLKTVLQKWNEDTQSWSTGSANLNTYKHLPDVIYPGESGELWLFYGFNQMLTTGKYRLQVNVFTNHLSESSINQWDAYRGIADADPANIAHVSYYEFDVKSNPDETVPENNVFENENVYESMPRNTWVHTFEEFTYSYDTWLCPIENEVYEGWLYLQIAPWTEHVTLRLVNEYDKSIKVVRVPLNVDTKSIKINFNPDNNNYVVNEDGLREPMFVTQNMTDMRVNYTYGPNADEIIAHIMLDMEECGVNTFTSTNGFFYDRGMDYGSLGWNFACDAFKFSTDLARLMGIQYIGHMNYPYTGQSLADIGYATGENLPVTELNFSDPLVALTNAVRAVTLYDLYGDTYYRDVAGRMPFFMEDQRGAYGMVAQRYSVGSLGELGATAFREFLEKVYDSIDKLNTAWGTDYKTFEEIDPIDSKQSNEVFANYTLPARMFDIFRTVERTENYASILDMVDEYIENPTFCLMQENDAYIVPAINPETANPRYRRIYYNDHQLGAIMPEIIAASGTIGVHTAYRAYRYNYGEIYELTKREIAAGITPMYIPLYGHTFDLAVNTEYGGNATSVYNSKSDVFHMGMQCLTSAFLSNVATYEAGGVPGAMWLDQACDGVLYATQKKELIFFQQKMKEALETPEGKAWAEQGGEYTYNPDGLEVTDFYNPDYVKEVLETARKEHNYGGAPLV